ncbi:hypothetical protein Rhe02_62960 [Rhizocola hellebori]|uniref:DUF6973 domain-containing protein n=1 Tax=Rhizocola hellebori TaxID=1392758 RepID=A0A8J3VIB3_9ACTN|nr:hypothetical protein [Rhizocola hellebori]GIH08229.1 hypothetical protein Rhe02_62960 [Rhizocola hellebori]
MTFRDEVKFIEQMRPEMVDVAAEDCKRVVRLVDSALPTLDEVKQKTEWSGEGKELLDRRLREADTLLEALRYGYDKAGRALDDYVTAQTEAKRLVGEGVRVENALGELIKHIEDPDGQPMKKWEDLRGTQNPFDWIGEWGEGDDIDKVRGEADRLFNEASDYYGRAKKTEGDSRGLVVAALDSARKNLPDFLANSGNAQDIIYGTPGLQDEIYQAAKDPNARRPGAAILGEYQVEDDPNTKMFPDAPLSWFTDQKELRESEARILQELQDQYGALGLKKFEDIKNEAFAEADRRFPSDDQNDDQNDAFRHAYWNARLTQEFGEDWAKRFTTAHESIPGNPAAREAMDLHNNEVGRSVATANSGASAEELANKIQEAVSRGRTVVIGSDGQLDYSDQVRPEDTGQPSDTTLPGHPQPGRNTGS